MERKLFSLGSLVHYRGSSYTSFLTPSEAPHPWFITGFSDAESCFSINIRKNKEFKSGWRVEAHFYIGLHKKDLAPERVDEQARCPLCPPVLLLSPISFIIWEKRGGGYRVRPGGLVFPFSPPSPPLPSPPLPSPPGGEGRGGDPGEEINRRR